MAKLQLKAVDHKNNIGQTITPGDEVVIVTTGYSHSVSIRKGVYLGKKNEGCSCRVVEQDTRYRFKETGEDVGYWWGTDAEKRGIMPKRPDYPQYPPAPRWGSPEYAATQAERQKISDKYNGEYAEYTRKVGEVGKLYESFKVPRDRYTTLQRNRIYKLDTSVFDLEV